MDPEYVTAQLNARLRPMDRGEFFEDPLLEILEKTGVGEVTGGGSLLMQSGEIENCEIAIEIRELSEANLQLIVQKLEELGAPKGSILHIGGQERTVSFGRNEGLAVYLNGTELPDEVYATYGFDEVRSEFDRLLDGAGRVLSFWDGPVETALYVYGHSFAEMRERLDGFLRTHPLCQRCRVEQIA